MGIDTMRAVIIVATTLSRHTLICESDKSGKCYGTSR
jgi:hypothetical protein